MIRVLHLLGADADFQTRQTSENLRRHLVTEFSFESKTLGRGGDFPRSIPAIRNLSLTSSDIVHAWGLRALAVAAFSGAKRIIFSPDGFAMRKTLRSARWTMGYVNVQMICSSVTQQRAALENGIMRSRCHVIRLGVDFDRIKARRDTALRSSLGITDDDFVLLAPGEATRASAHDDAIWAAGILHVLDPRYKLLIWGNGPRAAAAIEMARRIHQPDTMKVATKILGKTVEFESLLPAADCCLVTAKAPVPTLPIAMCMAAGMPIVSAATQTVSELLEDGRTALMVPETSPRLLAQRVLDVQSDSTLRNSISENARAKAVDYFSLTRQLDQYREAYHQFMHDQPIVIDPPGGRIGL